MSSTRTEQKHIFGYLSDLKSPLSTLLFLTTNNYTSNNTKNLLLLPRTKNLK